MRVKLFNSWITIELIDAHDDAWEKEFYPKGTDSDEHFIGKTYHETNHIVVKKWLQPSREKHTVLHELIHAILFETGHEHDEGTIDAISTGIINLFENNQKLGEYLVSDYSLERDDED